MKPTPEQKKQLAAEDWNLIEQYQFTRSDADFEKIVKRFESLLIGYAMKHRRVPREKALDATQDAFLWLYENVDALDRQKTILKQLLDAVKQVTRRKKRIILFCDCGDNRDDPSDFGTKIIDPAYENRPPIKNPRKKIIAVRAALAELTPKQREVAVEIFCNETAIKDSASVIGGGRSHIGKTAVTARARLAINPRLRKLAGLEPLPPTPPRQRRPGELTARQAAVVSLVRGDGISLHEAAKRLGLYWQTARYNYQSALKKIARSPELQKQYPGLVS